MTAQKPSHAVPRIPIYIIAYSPTEPSCETHRQVGLLFVSYLKVRIESCSSKFDPGGIRKGFALHVLLLYHSNCYLPLRM